MLDRDAESQALFITFHSEREPEKIVADKLAHAIHCKAVTFKDVIAEAEIIPPTQTRIAFHGHGDATQFGSIDHNMTPDEFAKELITLLTKYPHVKDIDLLSCNLGLIDQNGQCYAGIVQTHLDKAGFSYVNVNTFIVDNKSDEILDSFFVVGMSDELHPSLLKPNQFSLDILRKDNIDQIKVHQAIKDVEKDLYFGNVKMNLLASIRNVCKGDEVSLDNLKAEMLLQGYNEDIFNKIIKEYDVKVHKPEDEEAYFTCNIIDSSKKYMYKKDAQEDMYVIERQMHDISKKHEVLSLQFAKLRSESPNTRSFVSELKDIHTFLVPMHSVNSLNLRKKIQELQLLKVETPSKTLGKLITEVAESYKDQPTVQLLDIYAKNLAKELLTYKSSNPQRLSAINKLAVQIGVIYDEHLTKHTDIEACIKLLKESVMRICEDIRANHKATGTFSFPKFPGGGFSLTESSLARNLGNAMIKSDKEVVVEMRNLEKQPMQPQI